MSSEQIVAAILAPGVLGIIFFPYLQMARGKLVPETTLQAERVDKNEWRKIATDKDVVIAQQSAQLGEYMETTRVARHTLEALHEAANS